jgi:hypothetical protein
MNARFFDKIVEIVDSTVEGFNAHELVERHCKLIGKAPEDLRPEHAGLFIMNMMSSLSEKLPKKQWCALDRRFKILITESEPAKGKVKGMILRGTLDYGASKQGNLALSEIAKRIKLPTQFREDSWYPLAILEEFLNGVDLIMMERGGLRSRSVGRYVLSNNILRNMDFWFGSGQPATYNAFMNICEILSLDNFSVRKEEGVLLMSYEGDVDNHTHEFIMGICDGIIKIRNIQPNSVEFVENNNQSTIIFRFDGHGKEEAS